MRWHVLGTHRLPDLGLEPSVLCRGELRVVIVGSDCWAPVEEPRRWLPSILVFSMYG